MVLAGERDPDRLLFGARPFVGTRDHGRRPKPRRPGAQQAGPVAGGKFGGVGYSFCAAGPGEAWLIYAVPGPDVDPVMCGFLLRGGEYAHILAGERRVHFDADTGWPARSRSRRWTSSTAG